MIALTVITISCLHQKYRSNVVEKEIRIVFNLNFAFIIFSGNYAEFVNTMTERLKAQQREYEAQVEYRKHVQKFIDKFRFNAKRASLVQSRIKQLEKL